MPPIHAMTVQARGRQSKQEEYAAEHVNACGHHRRGVDQRADRRRAFHRVRQPDVQRELGALPTAPQKISKPASGGRCPERCGIARRVRPASTAKLKRAERCPDHQDAEQKPEVAQAIGDESLLAGIRRARSLDTRNR